MPQTVVHVYRDKRGRIPIADWLADLEQREPKAFAKCLQRILQLEALGHELRRPLADSLRDGIHELRAKHGHVNYRMLYFFIGRNESVISHGLTKEGKVPDVEIDRAVQRKKDIEDDPETYLADEVEWQ